MTRGLVGYTGFVGGNLASQGMFDRLINRDNLASLHGEHFSTLTCAALPAAKWIANQDPEHDRANMRRLCAALEHVAVDQFVLISTIDVYPVLGGADEDFDCRERQNHPYGTHRLEFEEYVRGRFDTVLTLRLPALFGPGLKKNVLYDLLTGNRIQAIQPESRFQWYPVERLSQDIDTALARRIKLVNLVTEPITTQTIVERFFRNTLEGGLAAPGAEYDLRTKHAAAFGGTDNYILSAGAVLSEIGRWLKTGARPR